MRGCTPSSAAFTISSWQPFSRRFGRGKVNHTCFQIRAYPCPWSPRVNLRPRHLPCIPSQPSRRLASNHRGRLPSDAMRQLLQDQNPCRAQSRGARQRRRLQALAVSNFGIPKFTEPDPALNAAAHTSSPGVGGPRVSTEDVKCSEIQASSQRRSPSQHIMSFNIPPARTHRNVRRLASRRAQHQSISPSSACVSGGGGQGEPLARECTCTSAGSHPACPVLQLSLRGTARPCLQCKSTANLPSQCGNPVSYEPLCAVE